MLLSLEAINQLTSSLCLISLMQGGHLLSGPILSYQSINLVSLPDVIDAGRELAEWTAHNLGVGCGALKLAQETRILGPEHS